MNETVNPPVAPKPLVIPIFIMNGGCPEKCVFCNEKIAAGDYAPEIIRSFFDAEVESYLRWNKDKLRRAEIAFYGGNFTGLPRSYQERLLSWAGAYLAQGRISSIRISTRPDYIDDNCLDFLAASGVRTVELGVQSFNDEVLRRARRGHDANASVQAIRRLKSLGFQTGVHLMAGLPGDTQDSFFRTLEQTADLRPATARIHPVLVFRDTPLADELKQGRYTPLTLSEAVKKCFLAWKMLIPAGIRIIRFGLQVTPQMKQEGAVLAGPLHPAFGTLVYGTVFLEQTIQLLDGAPPSAREFHFSIAKSDLSNFRGHSNRNVEAIKKLYPDTRIVIRAQDAVQPGRLMLACDTGESFFLDIPGIN